MIMKADVQIYLNTNKYARVYVINYLSLVYTMMVPCFIKMTPYFRLDWHFWFPFAAILDLTLESTVSDKKYIVKSSNTG